MRLKEVWYRDQGYDYIYIYYIRHLTITDLTEVLYQQDFPNRKDTISKDPGLHVQAADTVSILTLLLRVTL